jgi:ADP-ribose pyrophosphatase
MVSESFTLLRAHDLVQVGPGGGTESEQITVHRVPRTRLSAFIAERRAMGDAMDVKLLLLLGPELIG